MIDIIASVVILVGALFLLLASIGLLRMPDLYNRMQAGTKATTLGSILIFLGFIILNGDNWSKYLLLIIFIFFTNPLSSHALARAAHFMGINPILDRESEISPRDDLKTEKDTEAES